MADKRKQEAEQHERGDCVPERDAVLDMIFISSFTFHGASFLKDATWEIA